MKFIKICRIAFAGTVFSFLLLAATQAQQKIDYSEFDRLTRKYVNGQGLVDYAGLKTELSALKRFVDQLAAVSPDSHPQLFTDEKDKLRYFATAYNAWVLYIVTYNYPTKDIMWGRIAGIGPKLKFKDKQIRLGGQDISLETLEHKILRPRFADPRIHFYINCAALSCPPLPQGAIPDGKTDEVFDQRARLFMNNTKYVRYDAEKKKLYLSSIFKWFESDFLNYLKNKRGEQNPHIVQYVLLYLEGPSKEALLRTPIDQISISYYHYDTNLNEQKPMT
jgi:Protein of unknown function, DUF547